MLTSRYYFCKHCGTEYKITANQAKFDMYDNGGHVQDCFPDLNPDVRELLISGICGKCFDETFGNYDNQDTEPEDDFVSQFAPDEDIFNEANWDGSNWIGRK